MAALCWMLLIFTGYLLVEAATDPARTKRLTAFGKTVPSDNKKIVPKGKECRTEEDCDVIEFTSCMPDKIDNKLRCLCLGNEAPVNGECANKRRELHSKCRQDSECMYGAECTINATVNPHETMCYCKEGYEEENKQCNDGLARNAVISLIVFSSLVLFIFSTN